MSDGEYPKIDTLYERDEKHFVVVGKLKRPEFGNIKRWSVTEKLNGRNTRISLINNGDGGVVEYGGKTDDAEMPSTLLDYLRKTFTIDRMKRAFWIDPLKIPNKVTIYGEGYGPKMTSGSGIYRKDVSFRLFDCLVDAWWLERPNLEDVARKLGVKCVPVLGLIDRLPETAQDLYMMVNESVVAREESGTGATPEGVVARSDPILFNRKGKRVMWKLKIKDFKKQ